MPDLKISQLPAASTPLAGTELVPIVQGGTTDQTTVQAILTSAVPSGTANGVLYLNGSKVVTSGSGLTFDGNGLGINAAVGSTEVLRAKIKNIDVQLVVQDGFASGNLRLTAVDAGYTAYKNLEFSAAQSLFYVSGSEAMRLTSTGLGIGTASPAQKLHIYGAGNVVNLIESGSASGVAVATAYKTASRSWEIGQAPGIGNNNFTIYDATAVAVRATIDTSGNLGLGVTPSAWNSVFKAIQAGSGAAFVGSNLTSQSLMLANAYTDAGGLKYINTAQASYYQQYLGAHTWHTAPSGTAGNAISFTQAMTLDASGNLLVGVTTTSGSSSNGKFLTGGVFTTVNGATASTASGAAVTLFAAPNESTFMVTAYIFGAGAPASYNAVAIVKVSGGAATITTISSASNMTLSISGLNVQATQTSGASQSISYSAMRIA